MKKFTLTAILALSTMVATAADFVSVDVDLVRDQSTAQMSTAQYVRAGKEISGVQYGLQSRSSRYHDNSGLLDSLELTAGKGIAMFTPFVGVGFDKGFNGVNPYNYGLVGVTTGMKAGPGFALLGAKTRVGTTAITETKQSVAFATYSIPVTKGVSLNVNASKSYQDIQENAYGLGLNFGF